MRGYHVYKDIWATVVGEEFPCQREDGNRADPFAVAVVRGEAIVGHVPKKISVCSLYLRSGLGVWKGVQRLQISIQRHLFYFQSVLLVLESKF